MRPESSVHQVSTSFGQRLVQKFFLIIGFLVVAGFTPAVLAQTPARVTSVTTTNGKVIVRWQGGTAPYQVQCRSASSTAWQDIDGLTSSRSMTNVLLESSSFYRVISSVPAASDNKAPAVPAGVSAVAVSCSQINVTWNASTDAGNSGLKAYNIYRNGVFLKQVLAPATSLSDTGLAGATTYSYAVSAVDNARNQSAKSSSVSRTTPTCVDTLVPSMPEGFVATAATCNQINLSWNASTDTGGSGLKGYKIFRNGSFLKLVLAPATSTADSGLNASTSYAYSVSSIDNANNESSQTGSLNRTTPACVDTTAPAVPTGLNLTAVSCSQINIFWNASTDPGGSGVRAYNVFRNGAFLKQVLAPATFTSDSGLNASTSYSYTVSALDNANNESARTASLTASTPACPDGTAPTVPTGLTASAASCSQINISWNASTDSGGSGLKGYNVYRNGIFLKQVFAPATSSSDSGLAALSTYSFSVSAVDNANNESPQTTLISATTPECPDTAPPTVSLLAPGSGSILSNSISLMASASDNVGVTRVEFYSDSVSLGSDGATPFNLDYDSTRLANGSHNLSCKAFDAAGNFTVSAAITVQIRNSIAPTEAGQFLWAVTPGTSDTDGGAAVVNDAQGNAVILGNSSGNGIYLAKFSPSGTQSWARVFGTLGNSHSVAVDSEGNIFITGEYLGSANLGGGSLGGYLSSYSLFVAKYSPAGDHLWSKGFKGTFQTGNSGKGITIDRSGNVLLTGSFSSIDFGGGLLTGSQAIFVANLSGADGSYLWAKQFTGTGSGNGIAVDGSGNIFVTGYFLGRIDFGGGQLASPDGGYSGLLVKLTASGSYLWSKGFGAFGGEKHGGNAVAVAPNGDVSITGSFVGTVDFGGGPMSTRTTNPDVFFAKFASANGLHRWSKQVISSWGSGYGAAVDSNGNMLFTGMVSGTADFGSGPVSGTIFAVKYSPTGTCLWTKGYAGNQPACGISADSLNNVFVTGRWYGTVDFGDGARTSVGATDAFLLKFAP